MLTIDRRARNMFHAVTVALSPWRLVIDLGLLKALSVLQYTDDHLMVSHVSKSIDVSPHLLAVFQKHRVQANRYPYPYPYSYPYP